MTKLESSLPVLRITEELKNSLIEMAKNQNLSMSEIRRKALISFIEEDQNISKFINYSFNSGDKKRINLRVDKNLITALEKTNFMGF